MLNILQQRLGLCRNEYDTLIQKRNEDINTAKKNYVNERLQEELQKIESEYIQNRDRVKSDSNKTIDSILDIAQRHIELKVTGEITDAQMNSLKVLQQMDNVSEYEINAYVNQYKNSPMLMKIIKQIASKHGFIINATTVDEGLEILQEVRDQSNDFLNTYRGYGENYRHEVFLKENGIMNKYNNQLNQIIDESAVLEVKKMYGV